MLGLIITEAYANAVDAAAWSQHVLSTNLSRLMSIIRGSVRVIIASRRRARQQESPVSIPKVVRGLSMWIPNLRGVPIRNSVKARYVIDRTINDGGITCDPFES
jgi:hypothetical protein